MLHYCGGSGIRTHGGLDHTRSPGVPIRPLSHPSRRRDSMPSAPSAISCYSERRAPVSFVRNGSCATVAREPSQGRKAAALSGNFGVPQTACSSIYWPQVLALSSSFALLPFALWHCRRICGVLGYVRLFLEDSLDTPSRVSGTGVKRRTLLTFRTPHTFTGARLSGMVAQRWTAP